MESWVKQLTESAKFITDEQGHKKAVLGLPIWEEIVALLEVVHFVPIAEFAYRVKTDPNLVERLLASGALPGRQISGRWLVAAEVLDRFAPIERILDEMDAEGSPLNPEEAATVVSRGREGWTWVGKGK